MPVKCTVTEKRMLNLYFGSNLSMQEIGDKLGVTRQNISFHVVRAVKKKGIKFYARHIYKCRVCGGEIEKIREEEPSIKGHCKIRKKLERIVYHKFKCDDCIRNNLVKTCCCGTVGYKDYFYPVGGFSFVCKECSGMNTKKWVEEHRDYWNKYQRQFREKRKKNGEIKSLLVTPAV